MNTYRFTIKLEMDVAANTKAEAEDLLRDQLSNTIVDFCSRQRYIDFHPLRGRTARTGGWSVKGRKVESA